MHTKSYWGVLLGAALLSGCEREPLEAVCPSVAVGDLVVTEIRGEQAGDDSYRQWVELYNASGTSIDLYGLTVDFLDISDGTADRIVVRERNVIVQAGDFIVLGSAVPTNVPGHMDYGYLPDFAQDYFVSAKVTVNACGVVIDELTYRNITQAGTLSLDGTINPPTATANDDPNAWCVDNTPGTDMTQIGLPGSPKEMNRPCI